jgi:alanyl-tRNA synthetase
VSAGKIVGELALIVDGRGGGRNDMAMAGGKATDKIETLIKAIPEIIKKYCK